MASSAEATARASVIQAMRERSAAGEAPDAGEGERPHQVELLLHRQRPEVAQGRRPAHGLEVRLLDDDLVPVRDVGERRRRCRPGWSPPRRGGRASTTRATTAPQGEERREEASGPPGPEPQVGRAAGAGALGHQQGGDEVAGDDEEHLDAEEPTRQAGDVAVVEHDDEHGEGAQTVERRHVADGRWWGGRRRFGVGGGAGERHRKKKEPPPVRPP